MGPFVSLLQNIGQRFGAQPQPQSNPGYAPVTPAGGPPYTTNVNPFGGLVQGILGPTSDQRALAFDQQKFNAGQQQSSDAAAAKAKVEALAGDLLKQGVPPNQVLQRIITTPEFSNLVAIDPQADKAVTDIVKSIVDFNTPSAVGSVPPGGTPFQVNPGNPNVQYGQPTQTTAQINQGAGITSENLTQEEAAVSRLVSRGLLDRDLGDKILAGVVKVQANVDQFGHTTSYGVIDVSTGQLLKKIPYGDADAGALANAASGNPPSYGDNAPGAKTAPITPNTPQGAAQNAAQGTPGPQATTANPASTQYLATKRSNDQINVTQLDPGFADDAARAISAAEAATGAKASIISGYRDYAQQQQAYDNYQSGKGGLAAKPGTSYHEFGQALDIAPGPVLDWLHQHASEYGLEFLSGKAFSQDPVHMQLAQGGASAGSATALAPGAKFSSAGAGYPAQATLTPRSGSTPPTPINPQDAANFTPDPTGQNITPVSRLFQDPSTMFLGQGIIPQVTELAGGIVGNFNSQSNVGLEQNAQRNALRQLNFAVDALRLSSRITSSQTQDLKALVSNPNNLGSSLGTDPKAAIQNAIQLYDYVLGARTDSLKAISDNSGYYSPTAKDQASQDIRYYDNVLRALPTRQQMTNRLDLLQKGQGGQMDIPAALDAAKTIFNAGSQAIGQAQGAPVQGSGTQGAVTAQDVARMDLPALTALLQGPQLSSDLLVAATKRLGELRQGGQ